MNEQTKIFRLLVSRLYIPLLLANVLSEQKEKRLLFPLMPYTFSVFVFSGVILLNQKDISNVTFCTVRL